MFHMNFVFSYTPILHIYRTHIIMYRFFTVEDVYCSWCPDWDTEFTLIDSDEELEQSYQLQRW